MIYCFGDSWAAGAELKPGQQPFVHWVAQQLNQPYTNFGKRGSSLGLIVHSIAQQLPKIKSGDLVLVVVPPDTRWYDQNPEQGFYSISVDQQHDFLKFINYKTLEWFKYHHALFMYLIQKMLTDCGCAYIMMHNYGQIFGTEKYNFCLDHTKFLNQHDLTTLLTKQHDSWIWPDDHDVLVNGIDFNHTDGPPVEAFSGPYFEGCESHPNEQGHQEIARLILQKYHEQK